MADTKITGLTELTAVDPADVLVIVDDAGGTPVTKKATVENVQADWHVGARVYNSANISLAHGAEVVLTFDSERYDTDTIHSTSTNTERLTCQTAGVYLIIASVQIQGNAGGAARQVMIRLNGTTNLCNTRQVFNAADSNLSVSTIYELSATDYVTVVCYQDSGGALNAEAAGNIAPEFMMQRIG
jgi:hypothetical protein